MPRFPWCFKNKCLVSHGKIRGCGGGGAVRVAVLLTEWSLHVRWEYMSTSPAGETRNYDRWSAVRKRWSRCCEILYCPKAPRSERGIETTDLKWCFLFHCLHSLISLILFVYRRSICYKQHTLVFLFIILCLRFTTYKTVVLLQLVTFGYMFRPLCNDGII